MSDQSSFPFCPNWLVVFCFLAVLLLVHPIVAQVQLKPTKNRAVINFLFTNPLNNRPVPNKKFKITAKKQQFEANLTTDNNGMAAIIVPVDALYVLHLPEWENFAKVNIPKGAYQRHEIPVPCYDIPKDGSPVEIAIPVHLQLRKDDGSPALLEETLTIKSGSNRKTYQATTNKKGFVTIKLPIGAQYMLSLEGAPHYYKFEIPNRPYAAWTEDVLFERVAGYDLYPSINKGLFNFVFYNLEGELVADERFWVISQETGKRYESSTNTYGVAQILVPLNQTYSLHTTYNLNFGQKRMQLNGEADILVENVVYESLSSKVWKARQDAQEALANRRDSIAKAQAAREAFLMDSLKRLKLEDERIAELIRSERPIPIKRTVKIRKAIKAKVAYIEEQLDLNPNYFKDKSKPILATLQRFKENWKGKVVVTDVTHSMNPYLEEVLIWHTLNLQQGERNKYVFFNDGNKRMASDKQIGATGGIYTCEGAWEELPLVIATMQEAIEKSLGGGEAPENDLEAVLVGLKQKTAVEELILIADSYSRVRDMALLSAIDRPVRIILCGAEEGNQFYMGLSPDINEEYLTIAHRTKGSIHTLREDILNLSDTKEGEIVEIGAHRYLLRNRQFIKLPN